MIKWLGLDWGDKREKSDWQVVGRAQVVLLWQKRLRDIPTDELIACLVLRDMFMIRIASYLTVGSQACVGRGEMTHFTLSKGDICKPRSMDFTTTGWECEQKLTEEKKVNLFLLDNYKEWNQKEAVPPCLTCFFYVFLDQSKRQESKISNDPSSKCRTGAQSFSGQHHLSFWFLWSWCRMVVHQFSPRLLYMCVHTSECLCLSEVRCT